MAAGMKKALFFAQQKMGFWGCGERGIRTPGALTRTTVFETAPFDHSGISPFFEMVRQK